MKPAHDLPIGVRSQQDWHAAESDRSPDSIRVSCDLLEQRKVKTVMLVSWQQNAISNRIDWRGLPDESMSNATC
jgi:hypothetical protein